ncbi:MAG: globin domain-containing protein [Bacteroidota bacterium]
MKKEEIELMKSSWGWVLQNKADAGKLFYENLFKVAPTVRPLFDNDISNQATKLVSTVTFVVQHLNDFSLIKEQIRELGRKHKGYGAKPEYYPIVAEQLIYTIKQGMGDRFTPETEAAWNKGLSTIAQSMIEAAGK